MIGTVFNKPVGDWDAYSAAAKWCNDNNAKLVEYEDRYEIVVLPALTLEDLKAQKKAEIASVRYEAETAGTTVNDITIDTGRDSQALITGAALAAMLDENYSLNWKTAKGFIHLTAPEIIAVAQAVRAHVQSCFDREGELVAQVDAAQNAEELDAIDISFE